MSSFAEIQEAHRQLRLRLRVLAGENAFGEVTVNIPTNDDDELSFLRLVFWSYVLLQETGRVALRFLKELPPFSAGELIPEVGYLRTWATHNLLPDRASDRRKLLLAWAWLRAACGSTAPTTPGEWRSCFKSLSDTVLDVLQQALLACEALDGPDDGPRLLDELHRRLDRNWEAHRFDERVVEAQKRLGFDGIEPVSFRSRHLESWRAIVAAADEGSIDRLLEQRIERDLLDLMNNALPLTAREILVHLPLEDPQTLGLIMLAVINKTTLSKEALTELLQRMSRPSGRSETRQEEN